MSVICPKCNTDNPDTKKFCGDCGTQLTSVDTSQPTFTKTLETPKEEITRGTILAGRYEIIEELGKGGMGNVYRVVDNKINEEVALKLLKPEIAADKTILERFSNELKLARKIVHKNVGRMYHLGEDKGTHFITMEYVSGQDLKGLIRQTGQLAVGTVINIAKQVCDGMEEAHKLGVIHRDLKPNNIMIDREGNVRILDFGIARSLKEKGITGAGVIIGTPEYMSPEQVEGKEADQRADIYSLGVILYEMVTGRVPFEGDTPLSIAYKHKHEAPQDPRKINAQIPEDLSSLVLRCLEKDKEKRYQSSGELCAELENIEKGIPTTQLEIERKIPLTSKEITVTFRLKKFFVPALVIVALAIIAVLIWQLLPQKEVVPPPSGKPSLAVLYFENNTGDESLSHYRKAISDLLITDLSQSKYLKILSGASLYNILREMNLLEEKSYSSKDLKEISARGGVEHILLGNFTKAGENFRVSIMLHDAKTAELITSERADGRGEESIFSMVDELTRRIKLNFNISPKLIAADIDRNIEEITTSSPEALKYYSEAVLNFLSGGSLNHISLFEKAIAVDPDFAMAYRALGAAYSNVGNVEKRREYLQKAMELSDRVSDREKYIIQGTYYSRSEKTWAKAIEAYQKLLELYPDDIFGNANLPGLYSRIGKNDKAIELSEKARQYLPKSAAVYCNSAYYYFTQGLYDKAEEILIYYEKNISENISYIKVFLAFSFLFRNKYDLALAEIERSLSFDPSNQTSIRIKGDIYLFKGDFIQAEREYSKLMEKEDSIQIVKARLGALYFLQGKINESNAQVEKGLELQKILGRNSRTPDFNLQLAYRYLRVGLNEKALELCNGALSYAIDIEREDWQSLALYFKGLTFIGMKSMDETQRTADELKEIAEESLNEKDIRWYYHLLGLIELEKKDFSSAVEYFEKAIFLLNFEGHWIDDLHALFIEPLAKAYYQSGDLEKTRREYEKIISLTKGRLYYGDIYAKSFYMLGKIYEQLGDRGKAIEHYEKFLTLWKDADPGIAEVEDARKRLAGLQGN